MTRSFSVLGLILSASSAFSSCAQASIIDAYEQAAQATAKKVCEAVDNQFTSVNKWIKAHPATIMSGMVVLFAYAIYHDVQKSNEWKLQNQIDQAVDARVNHMQTDFSDDCCEACC